MAYSKIFLINNAYHSNIEEFDSGKLPLGGYYFWFANKEAFEKMQVPICEKLFYISHKKFKFYLCYLGIAPKSSSSKRTLHDRFKKNHLNGKIRNSTLRKSLGCLLNLKDEKAISDFIVKNFRVIIFEHKSPWNIEMDLIKTYSPPFNLTYNTQGWFYKEMKRLRKMI
jgi:GIY-YIG catalytic domain